MKELQNFNKQTKDVLYTITAISSNVPQKMCGLIPRTCEYVTLQSKWDFAEVNKVRTLRWGYYPGLPGWAQSDQGVLISGRREGGSESEKEM